MNRVAWWGAEVRGAQTAGATTTDRWLQGIGADWARSTHFASGGFGGCDWVGLGCLVFIIFWVDGGDKMSRGVSLSDSEIKGSLILKGFALRWAGDDGSGLMRPNKESNMSWSESYSDKSLPAQECRAERRELARLRPVEVWARFFSSSGI